MQDALKVIRAVHIQHLYLIDYLIFLRVHSVASVLTTCIEKFLCPLASDRHLFNVAVIRCSSYRQLVIHDISVLHRYILRWRPSIERCWTPSPDPRAVILIIIIISANRALIFTGISSFGWRCPRSARMPPAVGGFLNDLWHRRQRRNWSVRLVEHHVLYVDATFLIDNKLLVRTYFPLNTNDKLSINYRW